MVLGIDLFRMSTPVRSGARYLMAHTCTDRPGLRSLSQASVSVERSAFLSFVLGVASSVSVLPLLTFQRCAIKYLFTGHTGADMQNVLAGTVSVVAGSFLHFVGF